MRGFFITGTDTGVGKTLAAAALLAVLRKDGCDAVPLKPVQTGCSRGPQGLVASDLEFCLRLAGLEGTAERALMAPYRFEPACSPHLAAERAGQRIEIAAIAAAGESLAARHAAVVVEGAGGVLAPVQGETTMCDVMIALALPVVLVARPGLGTINHSLLSLRELRRAGLRVAGVLFNQAQPAWGPVEEDNLRTVARLGQVRVLGCLPYLPHLAAGAGTPQEFHAAVRPHLPAAAEWLAMLSPERT